MENIEFPKIGNFEWREWFNDGLFTISRKPLIDQADRVFTIGGCFAAEVRSALSDRQIVCLPDYAGVFINRAQYVVDNLPHELHMNTTTPSP